MNYRINSSLSGDRETLRGSLNENLLSASQRKSNAVLSDNLLIQRNQRIQGQVNLIEEEKVANPQAVVAAPPTAE